MKKIAVFIMLLSIFLIYTTCPKADSGEKIIETTLSTMPDTVNAGETVILTATTGKHGSAYNDGWNNAVNSVTTFDAETDSYVSKAEFIADKPGTYTISYSISMTAGNSNVAFSGKVERTIKVIGTVTLAGAEIRNLAIKPVYKADGSIYYYTASGTVYVLWSDQSATPYSSIFLNFGTNETVKNINVTIWNNGVRYVYPVTVVR